MGFAAFKGLTSHFQFKSNGFKIVHSPLWLKIEDSNRLKFEILEFVADLDYNFTALWNLLEEALYE